MKKNLPFHDVLYHLVNYSLCCPFRTNYRSSQQRCSMKKGVLEFSQNSQEKTCTRVIFLNEVGGLQACNFIKKETLAQVFSCEFCEIFKNTFFTEHLWTTASIIIWIFTVICLVIVSTRFLAQRRI